MKGTPYNSREKAQKAQKEEEYAIAATDVAKAMSVKKEHRERKGKSNQGFARILAFTFHPLPRAPLRSIGSRRTTNISPLRGFARLRSSS
jgi:hypothetical protein